MIFLWFFSIVTGGSVVFVLSLPLFFLLACSALLPASNQRIRRYDELHSNSFSHAGSSDIIPSATFSNSGDGDDGGRSTNRNGFLDDNSWNAGSQIGLGHMHNVTVFDLNADLSINTTGTGIMSSGLHDF